MDDKEKTIIRKTFAASEVKEVEGEDRTFLVTISTANPDRSGDIVRPEGMAIDNYLKNPVVSAFHDYRSPAIGQALEIQHDENSVIAKVKFADKGTYPLADTLHDLYRQGIMRAWSIGFMPLESNSLDGEGREFTKWELLEFASVLVPANPEALTIMRTKGFDPDKIMEEQDKLFQATNEKPYPNEHACRLREPGDFEDGSFRRTEREHDGKKYSVIMGKLKGEDKMTEQAYRYNKDTWEAETAKKHCLDHNGKFEAAKEATEPEKKEGRVLSEKNKKVVSDAIGALKTAQAALEELLAAVEDNRNDGDGKSVDDPTKGLLLKIRDDLRKEDKSVGLLLRDINNALKNSKGGEN